MKSLAFLTALGLACIPGAAGTWAAPAFKALHEFCSDGGSACKDGLTPSALVADAAGNLYGTAQMGGATYNGVVFEIAVDGSYRVIADFCNPCKTGVYPHSKLVIDTQGNLYGTASQGGARERGTVFKLSPDADRQHWTLSLLYAFCSKVGCADGSFPFAGLTYQGAQHGLPYDGVSGLYGATIVGGANGKGTVFVLTPGAKHKMKEKVLYDFCAKADCADGAEPETTPILDENGNIYGVTSASSGSPGVVYEIRRRGHGYAETVLHNFCRETGCTDGSAPSATPVFGADGRLYGPAHDGGAHDTGVLYAVAPHGKRSKYEVLYDFCSKADCLDGKFPQGGVKFDASGNIVGTAYAGGSTDGGVIFQLRHRKETVLYEFCSGCDDGFGPGDDLLQDSSGNLFGVTQNRGASGIGGVAFRLAP